MGWTRMRIRDNPVPARAETLSRKRIGNPSLWAICLSWKANLHACVRACVRLHVDVRLSGHACVSGWGWGGTSRPSPICSLAASRQPQLSVVADVCLCHGNARTGCTSGLQQGQAHAAAHTVPLPKGLLQRRTAWVQVGDKWCLCREGGRDGILHGVSGGEGRGKEEEDTRVHSPAEALLWELPAASLCPSEDAKQTAWEEELPSTGLVCGRPSLSFPRVQRLLTEGGLCARSCAQYFV